MKKKYNIFNVIGTLFIIMIIVSLISPFFISNLDAGFTSGNVAKINIEGVLTTQSSKGSLLQEPVLGSKDYVKMIKEAARKNNIKAIVLEINSPGGSPVATKEVVDAIIDAKKNKPVVAYIREVGASGAYWIASSSDYLIAHELSITGSVGVLASYIEFSGLFEKYGIDYIKLTGGKHKDVGSPFRNLTIIEKQLLQKKINYLHDIFFNNVLENRKLQSKSLEELDLIKSGIYFTSNEALKLGLIDKIGSQKDVEEYLKNKLNIKKVNYAEFISANSRPGLFGLLIKDTIQLLGKNIGYGFSEKIIQQQGIQLK